jgi:hypothetical protein
LIGAGATHLPALMHVELKRGIRWAIELLVADGEQGLPDGDKGAQALGNDLLIVGKGPSIRWPGVEAHLPRQYVEVRGCGHGILQSSHF